jgi:hypothetical protein
VAQQSTDIQNRPHSGLPWFIGVTALSVLAGLAFALFMAKLAAQTPVRQVGGEVSLSDILVTLLTISGVTVPLVIGYMTLGKGGDCFCAVAEIIPFFLSEKNYDVSTVKQTFLFWKDKQDNSEGRVTSALLTLYQFTKMPNWPSGEHIDWKAREHLLTGNHKERYHFYFEHGEDRHGLVRYAFAIGFSAILCFAGICSIYMRMAGEAFTFAANWLLVFNFLANIATYAYLVMLIRFKAEIRMTAIEQAKSCCDEIENDVRAAKKESEERGARATIDLQNAIRVMQERVDQASRTADGGRS